MKREKAQSSEEEKAAVMGDDAENGEKGKMVVKVERMLRGEQEDQTLWFLDK